MPQKIDKQQKKVRVLVGMSGGVDSSLTAALLVEQGYEVTGGFIKNWSDTKNAWTGECAWRDDRRDAMRVAAQLHIPLLTFDFEEAYRARVVDVLREGYAKGITPNPDVLCNQEIKFGLFFDEARQRKFDFVATGHYARVTHEADGTAHLLKGTDPEKDQSYFLYRISQEALCHTLFPIGHLRKNEVRKEAKKRGLATADKPDSQGICFIGKLDFHDFLRSMIVSTPGDIATPDGTVVGYHDGLDSSTIGQRQGLGVCKGGKAWYVAGKDRATNRLLVVPDRTHPALFRDKIAVHDMHWILGKAPVFGQEQFQLTIRYHEPWTNALLSKGARGTIGVQFERPVWVPAPGQSAVIYKQEECLGGGIILEELNAY